MDPTENENQALLLQAANLAAQYDYDGAITLLGTCTGEDPAVQNAVADYTAAKDTPHRLAGCGGRSLYLLPAPHCRYRAGF